MSSFWGPLQIIFWEKYNDELLEDYNSLKALDTLQFVHFQEQEKIKGTVYTGYFLTLFPIAFYRVSYERSNRFSKWLARQFENIKDWIASVAFVISVALFILKLYDYFSA
jgi:hypothetical protein